MKKRIPVFVLLLVLAVFLGWVLWANTALEVSAYTIADGDIPDAFDGFRIVQISDLHNASFGEDNEELLRRIGEAQPDIIVLTGDLVDSRNTDIGIGIRFAEAAVKIAPTYYVSGNHEARISACDELIAGLRAAGVTVLENEKVILEREGDELAILGLADPNFYTAYLYGDEAAVMAEHLESLSDARYSILLSHRPELFDTYVASGADLVFSGHAHGGQFRLPFVGGLFAPGQGFFPEYDAGLYTAEETTMLVSRGLGNSVIPLRVNNRPEIVIVTLEST